MSRSLWTLPLLMVSSPALADLYVHQGSSLRGVRQAGRLSGPMVGPPAQIAESFILSNRGALGLSATDLVGRAVRSSYESARTRVRHVVLEQRYAGVAVEGALLNVNLSSTGEVISLGNRFIPSLAEKIGPTQPRISAAEAALRAAKHLGLRPGGFNVVQPLAGSDLRGALNDAGIARGPIGVRLAWAPVRADRVRLAWRVEIDQARAAHYYVVLVDATDGGVLDVSDLVVHDHFGEPSPGGPERSSGPTSSPPVSRLGTGERYEVFELPAEYPYENNDPGDPTDDVSAGDPAGGRTIVVEPYLRGTGSPYGWHDVDGVAGPEYTLTQGNNVDAYEDRDDDDLPSLGSWVDGGPTLNFTGALVPLSLPSQRPHQYTNASVVNLFYVANVLHDVLYEYGFDEVSGNFQFNNYGNGGLERDEVRTEAQDGGGLNNANFYTPIDGSNPRMQMYEWTSTALRRDASLSNNIIAHEYAHGLSNRLTGGPNGVSCLNNPEQMGEGWSDFVALVMTAHPGDVATTVRGMGTYVKAQPPDTGAGIRPAPYTTDFAVNAYTYADIDSVAIPHGVGFVWASMLWDVYWALVDAYGFNADLYEDWTTGGNNLALQLIIDGMKLQPCSPGFVDGRDAILDADQILTGGANQCLIWRAFARRGLGLSADQGWSGSVADGTETFDVPVSCAYITVAEPTQTICAGTDAAYELTIGTSFDAPVSLSTVGLLGGLTEAFSVNPVSALPGPSTFTAGNTDDVATGSYSFSIRGDDGAKSFEAPVGLEVYDGPAGAFSLSAPVDGAAHVNVNPTFEWGTPSNTDRYTLEIATDPAFTNVVVRESGIEATQHSIAPGLEYTTTYYWRVLASNVCGTTIAGPFSFETGIGPGDCAIAIPAQTHFEYDVEGPATGWTYGGQENQWSRVLADHPSGLYSFFTTSDWGQSDQHLITPVISLPVGGLPITFRFDSQYHTENALSAYCYDGAVLELSTNGADWIRLEDELLTDPYDAVVPQDFESAIGGGNAWCGDQEWLESIVDISAWAGQDVQLRFRYASDNAIGSEGWWVDDIVVRSCPTPAAPAIFSGGFESGDASAWSIVVP